MNPILKALIVVAVYLEALMILPGCGTTMHTKALSVGPDGSSQLLEQKASAPPFSKLAEGAGNMKTAQGADGSYTVQTGQNITGVDNTGQIAAFKIPFDFATQAIAAYLGSALAQPKAPDASGATHGIDWTALLQAWMAAQGGATPKFGYVPTANQAPFRFDPYTGEEYNVPIPEPVKAVQPRKASPAPKGAK